MNELSFNFWGKTKYWWIMLVLGLLMIPCGFFYWLSPVAGYEVASALFGWLLVVAGTIQLVVGARVHPKVKGRWWWIIGGVLDIFIGFMLVRSIILSEAVLPYFMAFVFLYWGIGALISAFASQARKYWWLHLINGILMSIIGFMFLEGGWVSNMLAIDFLFSIAFIYWGFSLCVLSYDLKPRASDVPENEVES